MTNYQRLWEIDALRGIAIVMMVSYHIYFDIYFLKIFDVPFFSAWYIGALFLFLVGVSLTLSYSRVYKKYSFRQLLTKYAKRGVMVFSLGLLITGVTWLIIPQWFIIFGILHCIGLCIILGFLVIHGKTINIVLGLTVIMVGLWLYTMARWGFSWLFWLGFVPNEYQTLDYFPLLPWFGVVLLGIAVGNILYAQGKRQFLLPDWSSFPLFRFLGTLGKHSLLIYLIHQPIILAIIFASFKL